MESGDDAVISQDLLDLLQCPAGTGTLFQHGNRLVCRNCGASYPIRDGIPILLLDEATLPAGIRIDEIVCSSS